MILTSVSTLPLRYLCAFTTNSAITTELSDLSERARTDGKLEKA